MNEDYRRMYAEILARLDEAAELLRAARETAQQIILLHVCDEGRGEQDDVEYEL